MNIAFSSFLFFWKWIYSFRRTIIWCDNILLFLKYVFEIAFSSYLVKWRPFKVYFLKIRISHRKSFQYCFWPIIHEQITKVWAVHHENSQAHKNTSHLSGCYRKSRVSNEYSWKFYRTSEACISTSYKVLTIGLSKLANF